MRRLLAATLASLAIVSPALADTVLLVPKTVIYPRDVIRDDMLEERTYSSSGELTGYVGSRAQIIGRIARLTLLPGRPVPVNAFEEPRLISVGTQVRIVFEEKGITIVTFGMSLQNGTLGDLIRVRNSDSGLIVSGKVQPDGSIRVGEG